MARARVVAVMRDPWSRGFDLSATQAVELLPGDLMSFQIRGDDVIVRVRRRPRSIDLRYRRAVPNGREYARRQRARRKAHR